MLKPFYAIFPTVLCPALTMPSNGEVDYSIHPLSGAYSVDTVATFRCTSGYKKQGSSSRTCQPSGHWNQQTPTCSRSTIDILSTPIKYIYYFIYIV